jgi:hypothetical protein
MPLDQILHITAIYSNAVLTAILPHVNDFAKKMDLPIPSIERSQVSEFRVNPIQGHIGGGLFLTNQFMFIYENGSVIGFRAPTNFFYDDSFPLNIGRYSGKDNMTTNDAMELARSAIRVLGYEPESFFADRPPESLRGPFDTKDGHHVPYCEIRWIREAQSPSDRTNSASLEFQINLESRSIVGMSIVSPKTWRMNPEIDVTPETEKEFQMKHSAKMFIRSNAPAVLQPAKPIELQATNHFFIPSTNSVPTNAP